MTEQRTMGGSNVLSAPLSRCFRSRAARPVSREARSIPGTPALLTGLIVDREGPFDDRQREAMLLALRKHGPQILAERVHIEGHRLGLVSAHSLRDHGPTRLQNVGAARRVGEQVNDALRIEAKMAAERVSLTQR